MTPGELPTPLRDAISVPSGESSVNVNVPELGVPGGIPTAEGLNDRGNSQASPGVRLVQVPDEVKPALAVKAVTFRLVEKSAELVSVTV